LFIVDANISPAGPSKECAVRKIFSLPKYNGMTISFPVDKAQWNFGEPFSLIEYEWSNGDKTIKKIKLGLLFKKQ